MTKRSWTAAVILGAVLASGCQTVPYDPRTTSDTTAPVIGLRVTGDSTASRWVVDSLGARLEPRIARQPLDVGARSPTMPVPPVPVKVHEHGQATVLATAQDNESGVESISLDCQRRVYYNYDAAGPTESDAVLEISNTRQANQVTNGQAPLSALTQQTFDMWGRMAFPTADGTPRRAHRVTLTCSAQATNFNRVSARSVAVLVWAQDHAVQP